MSTATICPVGVGTLFARVLHAELLKLASAGFVRVTAGLTALVTLAAAAGVGLMVRNSVARWDRGQDVLQPQIVLLGLLTAGIVALLVSAAWLVLGEFSSRTAALTFTAMPDRVTVLLAKALLAGLVTAVLSWVLVPAAFVISESAYRGAIVLPHHLLADGGGQVMLTLPLVFGCFSAVAVAVAALVRNTAATVTLIVLWYGVAEDFLSGLPGVGPVVAAFLPVAHGFHAAGIRDASSAITWAPAVSGGYVVALTLVLVAAACWATVRRDIRT